MRDGVINLTEPEVLLYERMPNGTFKLTAVEYYMQANQTATDDPARLPADERLVAAPPPRVT